MSVPSVGVEEEFLLVDPQTGEPVARNADVARYAGERGVDLQLELTTCQVETATDKADTSSQLREQITRLRRVAADASAAAGATLLAVGLPPTVPHHFPITDTPRYHQIAERFGMIAHEQGICGCHVHVEVPGPGSGNRCQQPVAAVAAAAAGADRQFGDLSEHRHRLRELAQCAVGPLAERGAAAACGVRRTLRRGRRHDARRRGDARRRHGLLGRAAVQQVPHSGGQGRRRAGHRRRDGTAGDTRAGVGDDGTGGSPAR